MKGMPAINSEYVMFSHRI